jgi:hypothetical protein
LPKRTRLHNRPRPNCTNQGSSKMTVEWQIGAKFERERIIKILHENLGHMDFDNLIDLINKTPQEKTECFWCNQQYTKDHDRCTSCAAETKEITIIEGKTNE